MTDHHTTVDTDTDTDTDTVGADLAHTNTHITGGVDTHKDTHTTAALDGLGRLLGTRTFPATTAGYTALHTWLTGLGPVTAIGVEGTGSYGAGLARHLRERALHVVEVNQPDRHTRRRAGKSDTQDAVNAARAVQSGRATATPKAGTGPATAVTALRTVRAGAVKSRTAALNQLQSLIVTAPALVREALAGLTGHTLTGACARLRPGADPACPTAGVKTALRRLARRIVLLTTEIDEATAELRAVTQRVLPRTTALVGVGPDTAAQMMITAGDNPGRIDNEARFAHLIGTAPILASSGRTDRHRLDRGGDRQGNAAAYRVVLVRMRHCPRTRAYVERRTAEGLPKRHIIRCLKRYVTREIYRALIADMAELGLTATT
jgi:transposase